MERKLKFHEKKLLRKTDFINWKSDDNIRVIQIMRRYHIQKKDDYVKYNIIVKMLTKLAHGLSLLDTQDEFRVATTEQLLEKLYNMGLINSKNSLNQVMAMTASQFCRRRLSVILVKNKYCETLKQAVTFIEHGHIRVGPQVVSDPAFHVTRSMEDFITWTDTSKIRKKIMKYHDKLDDFDFLQ